nr:hypothetical protein Iba_chr09dCG6860 [Ipomoea batatas]
MEYNRILIMPVDNDGQQNILLHTEQSPATRTLGNRHRLAPIIHHHRGAILVRTVKFLRSKYQRFAHRTLPTLQHFRGNDRTTVLRFDDSLAGDVGALDGAHVFLNLSGDESLLNISPPAFVSIQISQNASEDSPASDCLPGVCVFAAQDIRASCSCSSSAYFSSEMGKISSSSYRAEKFSCCWLLHHVFFSPPLVLNIQRLKLPAIDSGVPRHLALRTEQSPAIGTLGSRHRLASVIHHHRRAILVRTVKFLRSKYQRFAHRNLPPIQHFPANIDRTTVSRFDDSLAGDGGALNAAATHAVFLNLSGDVSADAIGAV